MGETTLRLILVASVGAVAVLTALIARRGRSIRRHRFCRPGHPAGVFLFVSSGCSTCGSAQEALDEVLGPEGYERVVWEEEPERFRTLGIERVPHLVSVGADGTGWTASGVLSVGRLRAWLGDP